MNTESPGSHLLPGLKHKVSLCSGHMQGFPAGCRYLGGGGGGGGAKVVPGRSLEAGLSQFRGCCLSACLLKAGVLLSVPQSRAL